MHQYANLRPADLRRRQFQVIAANVLDGQSQVLRDHKAELADIKARLERLERPWWRKILRALGR